MGGNIIVDIMYIDVRNEMTIKLIEKRRGKLDSIEVQQLIKELGNNIKQSGEICGKGLVVIKANAAKVVKVLNKYRLSYHSRNGVLVRLNEKRIVVAEYTLKDKKDINFPKEFKGLTVRRMSDKVFDRLIYNKVEG